MLMEEQNFQCAYTEIPPEPQVSHSPHDIICSTVRSVQSHYPEENLVFPTGFAVIETNKKWLQLFLIVGQIR